MNIANVWVFVMKIHLHNIYPYSPILDIGNVHWISQQWVSLNYIGGLCHLHLRRVFCVVVLGFWKLKMTQYWQEGNAILLSHVLLQLISRVFALPRILLQLISRVFALPMVLLQLISRVFALPLVLLQLISRVFALPRVLLQLISRVFALPRLNEYLL